MDEATRDQLRTLPKFSDEWQAAYRSAQESTPYCARCHGIRWVQAPGSRWRQMCPDCT